MADKDIEPVYGTSGDEDCVFESSHVYLLRPLEFGGFIAFDSDNVYLYRKRIRSKIVSKRLRNPMKITAICPIDEYDPQTKRTKDGTLFMRYLIANEQGELYMMAF